MSQLILCCPIQISAAYRYSSFCYLILLHSEQPKLYGVLSVLSAKTRWSFSCSECNSIKSSCVAVIEHTDQIKKISSESKLMQIKISFLCQDVSQTQQNYFSNGKETPKNYNNLILNTKAETDNFDSQISV